MKRVAIIGSVGLPAQYGGWETLVEQLTRALGDRCSFTVFCSAAAYPHPRLSTYNGADLEYIPLRANGIQSIPYDLLSMAKAAGNFDTMLILGVSGCVFLPLIKPWLRARVVVNIDGLEWRRAKWGPLARWFLRISEAMAVRAADAVISDNEGIRDYVQATYSRRSELIAYGGDHAAHSEDPSEATLGTGLSLPPNYALSVCRIEPENNIHLLVDAFTELPDRQLVLVGNWSNSEYGESLRKRIEMFSNIQAVDPIYDAKKINALRQNCAIYLHGHSAGGTNPSLVEAMWLGLPILAYDCNFNRYTTAGAARFFRTPQDLRDLVRELTPVQCEELGRLARGEALKRFTWQHVAARYAEVL